MRQLEETLLLLADQDPSVDPGQLIDRIERDLTEEGVPVVALDGRRTMQTRERPQVTIQPRRARKAWVFAAGLVAAVAAIAIPVWLFGGEGGGEVFSEPRAVFTWGEDLSEWVTEEEMAQALADVVRQYRGANLEDGVTVSLSRPDGEGDDGWGWEGVGWSVQVHSGDHDGRVDVEPTQTDPRLPEGVTYQEGWGLAWMSRILVGPNSDESICVTLVPADRAFEDPEYEDMVFAIASMMLREMGWAD